MPANRDHQRRILLISILAAACVAVAFAVRWSLPGVGSYPRAPEEHLSPNAVRAAQSNGGQGEREDVTPQVPEPVAVRVFAQDEAGRLLPDALFLVLSGLANTPELDERLLTDEVRSALPSLKTHGSVGQLLLTRLHQHVVVAWVLADCEGHHAAVCPVYGDRADSPVILRTDVHIEVALRGLPTPSPEIVADALPVAELPDGKAEQRLLVLRRERSGYSIASQGQTVARGGAGRIDGLVAGAHYVVICTDPTRHFTFATQAVEAPASITIDALEKPGVTLLFSAPIPKDGAIVWTPIDRKPNEERLFGRLLVDAGATTAFVPLPALDRQWFVDACGEAWCIS